MSVGVATRVDSSLGVGGLDGAYELCVELGQPWLALAIKDQKGVYHIERLCGLRCSQGGGKQSKWSRLSG